jgi:hypothetical protein
MVRLYQAARLLLQTGQSGTENTGSTASGGCTNTDKPSGNTSTVYVTLIFRCQELFQNDATHQKQLFSQI